MPSPNYYFNRFRQYCQDNNHKNEEGQTVYVSSILYDFRVKQNPPVQFVRTGGCLSAMQNEIEDVTANWRICCTKCPLGRNITCQIPRSKYKKNRKKFTPSIYIDRTTGQKVSSSEQHLYTFTIRAHVAHNILYIFLILQMIYSKKPTQISFLKHPAADFRSKDAGTACFTVHTAELRSPEAGFRH